MNAKHLFKQLGNYAFLFSGTFLLASLVLSFFPAQQVSARDTVSICHSTGSGKYVSLSIDVSSLNKWETQGHGSHPNDIWASFTTDDGHFVAGQGDISILNNGCEVPATPTDTDVPPVPTDTTIPPTLTDTPIPNSPTDTLIPNSPTLTAVRPTLTYTPVPLTPTPIQVVVIPPASGGSNVLLPVTGVDLGGFSRGLPRTFANLCLGFLGLGLVLKGIARRYDK